MKYVTRDGKEGDRAWMLAVGDSERGPEDEGIQVRHKENMSLEYSRAKPQEQDYPLCWDRSCRDQKGP